MDPGLHRPIGQRRTALGITARNEALKLCSSLLSQQVPHRCLVQYSVRVEACVVLEPQIPGQRRLRSSQSSFILDRVRLQACPCKSFLASVLPFTVLSLAAIIAVDATQVMHRPEEAPSKVAVDMKAMSGGLEPYRLPL